MLGPCYRLKVLWAVVGLNAISMVDYKARGMLGHLTVFVYTRTVLPSADSTVAVCVETMLKVLAAVATETRSESESKKHHRAVGAESRLDKPALCIPLGCKELINGPYRMHGRGHTQGTTGRSGAQTLGYWQVVGLLANDTEARARRTMARIIFIRHSTYSAFA